MTCLTDILPSGGPQPLPYSLKSDDLLAGILLACFLFTAFVLSRNSKFLYQLLKNFLLHREFLDTFAKHYETGETIPQELIDRVVAASQYAAGYLCVRQLNFGYLDMAYHTITEPINDVFAFEADAIKDVKQFDAAPGCLISPVFSHIFSGGYAAGYYSYKWSEVLDADAFSKFEEDGIFNPQTAKSFKDNILSTGGTEDPKILYKRFRGRDAKIDALLKRDGISK